MERRSEQQHQTRSLTLWEKTVDACEGIVHDIGNGGAGARMFDPMQQGKYIILIILVVAIVASMVSLFQTGSAVSSCHRSSCASSGRMIIPHIRDVRGAMPKLTPNFAAFVNH